MDRPHFSEDVAPNPRLFEPLLLPSRIRPVRTKDRHGTTDVSLAMPMDRDRGAHFDPTWRPLGNPHDAEARITAAQHRQRLSD